MKSDRVNLVNRLVLSIELDTVQTGTGMVDPARKLKCTTAAREETWTNHKFYLYICRRVDGLMHGEYRFYSFDKLKKKT